jgi:beta-glucosidase
LGAHGIANDGATAAKKAFLAGVDMDMVSGLYRDHLPTLVQGGAVPVSAVDEAVRRVLRVKFALGLFENPYVDESKESGRMLRSDAVAAARGAAEKSFVLLKNTPGSTGTPTLPLARGVRKIAVIGPLADDPTAMLGSWEAKGRAEDATSLRVALVQRLGARNVYYAKGTDYRSGTDQDIAEAVTVAAKGDVIVLALGEQPKGMTGEAASRANIDLPGRQQELLEKISAIGKPVVLVLFSGRPLAIPWAFDHIPAVLAAWVPGIQAGPALVRTLYGEFNPSGKLPVSWPRSVGQLPLYYDALRTGRPADAVDLSRPAQNEAEKYVSRYIDEPNSPQRPFGFGLSYTSYRYGAVELSAKTTSATDLLKGSTAVQVSARVTNTGKSRGEEIVQLYVGLRGTSVAQPMRALKGFQKIYLAPEESRKVIFTLNAEALGLWNDANKQTVEASRATIWIAPDSASGAGVDLEILP